MHKIYKKKPACSWCVFTKALNQIAPDWTREKAEVPTSSVDSEPNHRTFWHFAQNFSQWHYIRGKWRPASQKQQMGKRTCGATQAFKRCSRGTRSMFRATVSTVFSQTRAAVIPTLGLLTCDWNLRCLQHSVALFEQYSTMAHRRLNCKLPVGRMSSQLSISEALFVYDILVLPVSVDMSNGASQSLNSLFFIYIKKKPN